MICCWISRWQSAVTTNEHRWINPSGGQHNKRTDLVVIREEQIAIDLVDEHLEEDVRVVAVRTRHGVVQPGERLGVRLVLRVDHKHDRAAVAKDHLLVHELAAIDQVLCNMHAHTVSLQAACVCPMQSDCMRLPLKS